MTCPPPAITNGEIDVTQRNNKTEVSGNNLQTHQQAEPSSMSDSKDRDAPFYWPVDSFKIGKKPQEPHHVFYRKYS